MYYCPSCRIAGDIDHEWCGEIGCFNCGQKLQEDSHERIKSEGYTEIIKPPVKDVEESYP
jgi:hypothetical protein